MTGKLSFQHVFALFGNSEFRKDSKIGLKRLEMMAFLRCFFPDGGLQRNERLLH